MKSIFLLICIFGLAFALGGCAVHTEGGYGVGYEGGYYDYPYYGYYNYEYSYPYDYYYTRPYYYGRGYEREERGHEARELLERGGGREGHEEHERERH